jgi:hypothetical protein
LPCLSICLLIFYDSSASALFYQTICMPPSSHTHALPVCKAACHSSMTALPQRCSIKLSVICLLSSSHTLARTVWQTACHSSKTALPQRCYINYLLASLQPCLSGCLIFFPVIALPQRYSIKIFACFPPALPMPCLLSCLPFFCERSASVLPFYQTIYLPQIHIVSLLAIFV